MILQRHKSSIFGLNQDLVDINNAISTEEAARIGKDGDLTLLSTVAKSDLVTAINEVLTTASAAAADSLQIAANLSDVADVAAARTNLSVSSSAEVTAAIEAATLAMGTNYSVATILERDALNPLDVADRVFVADSGAGTWSLYKVAAVDPATGQGTSWIMVQDQAALEASISAPSIKAAYESNLDTNAYTDIDEGKVALLTVTQAIDLDDAVLSAELVQDLSLSAAIDLAPSVAAVKAYADAAATAGGSIPTLETLTVAGSEITLSAAPKGGVSGVMNFATCRYVDGNGVAFDAPIVATANPLVFGISTDTTDQWHLNQVQIQYLYTAG